MSLSSTYIEDFDPTEPDGQTKKLSVLDDHIKMLKSVLKFQLGSLGRDTLTVTAVELNQLAGVGAPELLSRKGAASGYCGLDGSSLVALANIPSVLTGKQAATALLAADATTAQACSGDTAGSSATCTGLSAEATQSASAGTATFAVGKATADTHAMRRDNYATSTLSGTVTMRVESGVLYLRNDGGTA